LRDVTFRHFNILNGTIPACEGRKPAKAAFHDIDTDTDIRKDVVGEDVGVGVVYCGLNSAIIASCGKKNY